MPRKRELIEENEALARDKAELSLRVIQQQRKVEEITRARDAAVRARDRATREREEAARSRDAALAKLRRALAELDALRHDRDEPAAEASETLPN